MYLEKLEIQGFKSFALPTTLTFKPGITAIVGPNGSGKSNIADAARWVLGEQSMKTLRGKKAEDVIFSGSDSKARLGMAEVSLYLNNEDRQAPIDYTELMITRRLYRDGESEYLLNKNRVRLQDIQLLLAKANFGQRSYSIIGQGMIDSILSASTQERKEFFDEATGVRQFQIKKDQALSKLTASLENLRQVEAVLLEIEPRLRSLTRQVKRLERREVIETELKQLQKNYYGFLWRELDQQRVIRQQNYQRLNGELKQKEEVLAKIQAELKNLEQEESRSTVFDQLQNQYQNLFKQKNELREKELRLANKIEFIKRERAAESKIMPLTEIIDELETALNFMQQADTASLANLQKIFNDLQKRVNRLVTRLKNPADAEAKIDPALTKELETIRQGIGDLNEQLNKVQQEIQNFNKREEGKKGKFFELQKKFQQETFAFNRLQAEVNDVKIELTRLETKQEDLETEIKRELTDPKNINLNAQNINPQEAYPEIGRLKHQLELIGAIDEETVDEYKTTKERFDFLNGQATDLRTGIENLEQVITDLEQQIKKQFDVSFKTINEKFGQYFKVLFNGGKASLVLQKAEEKIAAETAPTTAEDKTEEEKEADELLTLKQKAKKIVEGIEIKATPPGKKLRSVNMLSGGERALTSIALISAIISINPSPFVILDEVDAALDESNSIRFASIIQELSTQSQFIAITHNRYTMEYAKVLYGVTMGEDGVSKILSLNLEDAKDFDETGKTL